MARGKAHDQETRSAVIAALLSGQGVSEVAKQYNLNPSVVSRLKASIAPEDLEKVATVKKEQLTDLVEAHLIASLKAAVAIAGQANDDSWRSKQPASELAVFYGVLSDKSIRLIEIAGRILGGQRD